MASGLPTTLGHERSRWRARCRRRRTHATRVAIAAALAPASTHALLRRPSHPHHSSATGCSATRAITPRLQVHHLICILVRLVEAANIPNGVWTGCAKELPILSAKAVKVFHDCTPASDGKSAG